MTTPADSIHHLRHRILVVDDETVIRSFLVRVLERAGYDVEAASDGRAALNCLTQRRFDLLLSDIKMEHLDGVELLREAKTHQPDIAVILLTGHATVPSAIEALRQGAHDYLLKPVKNEDILQAVEAGLDSRKRQQRRDQLEAIAEQMLTVVQGGGALADDTSPADAPPARQKLVLGTLELDASAYIARLNDTRLDLTPTEFRLLLELTRANGAAIDFVNLVQSACGYTCTRNEAREIIGTHVLNLRSKLGIESGAPYYVESVRGVGYRLVPPGEN